MTDPSDTEVTPIRNSPPSALPGRWMQPSPAGVCRHSNCCQFRCPPRTGVKPTLTACRPPALNTRSRTSRGGRQSARGTVMDKRVALDDKTAALIPSTNTSFSSGNVEKPQPLMIAVSPSTRIAGSTRRIVGAASALALTSRPAERKGHLGRKRSP